MLYLTIYFKFQNDRPSAMIYLLYKLIGPYIKVTYKN